MKKVLFITRCKYPEGDASSKRYKAFIHYFLDRGFKPIFIGMGNTNYKKEVDIGGCKVLSFRKYKKPNAFQKIINHLFIKDRIIRYASQKYASSDIVFVEPSMFMRFLKYRNSFYTNIIICSAVEFYSPSEYAFGGKFSRSYKENIRFNTDIKPDDCRIIAISSYLESHFKNKGMMVVRVPFVLVNENPLIVTFVNVEKRKFIYCGNPRTKDNLKDILLAFSYLDDVLLSKTVVNIFGVKEDWIHKQKIEKTRVDKILSFTRFHGIKPYVDIKNEYEHSDFSLLLRPSLERYAAAGFPTKISESLEFGIPPITNFTSDLSFYLKDMYNCVEVKGDTLSDFLIALKESFKIPNDILIHIKENAKRTAVEQLDIKHFYPELDFITSKHK